MKVTVTVPRKIDIKYLRATMGVRYWVDCDYSDDGGTTWFGDFDDTDEESERIKSIVPCVIKKDIGYRENDYWELIIDLDQGRVLNWPKGFCIKTHYKVCDDGEYIFLDENKKEVVNITDEYDQCYVPDFLAIEDNGYGDYVYINIDGDGKIEHFDVMKREIENYFADIDKGF